MSVEFIAAAPEKLDIVDFESVCCGYFQESLDNVASAHASVEMRPRSDYDGCPKYVLFRSIAQHQEWLAFERNKDRPWYASNNINDDAETRSEKEYYRNRDRELYKSRNQLAIQQQEQALDIDDRTAILHTIEVVPPMFAGQLEYDYPFFDGTCCKHSLAVDRSRWSQLSVSVGCYWQNSQRRMVLLLCIPMR